MADSQLAMILAEMPWHEAANVAFARRSRSIVSQFHNLIADFLCNYCDKARTRSSWPSEGLNGSTSGSIIRRQQMALRHGPTKGGRQCGFPFLFVALAIGAFLASVCFSFTRAWRWFNLVLIAMRVIWRVKQKGSAENLLAAAMFEKDFYDRFRAAGAWQYEMSEEDA